MADPQRTFRLPAETLKSIEREMRRQNLTFNGWFRRYILAALAQSTLAPDATPAQRKRKPSRALR